MRARLPPYADPAYAATACAAGDAVLPVAAWGGAAVVLRQVPETGFRDAAGPYPLLPFDPAWDVAAGLEEIAAAGAISLVLVADPLSPPATMDRFTHQVAYKRHHLVLGGEYRPSEHHRREIRRAAARAEAVEIAPAEAEADWTRLYGNLAARRGFVLDDAARFAPQALRRFGLRLFAVRERGAMTAMALWLSLDDRAWYHLGAADDAGRRSGASYLALDLSIRTLLADGIDRLVLGGGLAPIGAPPCGLDRFKAGFGNAMRPSTLLGAVLDARAYAALGGGERSGFFPSYRAPQRSVA